MGEVYECADRWHLARLVAEAMAVQCTLTGSGRHSQGCMAVVLQEALLESFLIIPAQLAHLLTFVPRIMPPLVSSLQVC